MNNETKWDVFKRALKSWDDLVHEQELQGEESHGACEFDQILIKYKKDYDAALPDDLPVIPKAVGVHIRWCKSNTGIKAGIGNLLDALELSDWAGLEAEYWINDNPEVFARAWLLGAWHVEETGEIVKLEAEK